MVIQNNIKYFRKYWWLTVTAFFCLSTTYPQANKPDWVTERPNLKDYYIGIVQVDIEGKPKSDDIQKANHLAFKEISEQIRVSVTSNLISITTDTSGYAKSLLFTESISNLEGIEKVDTYSDGKYFWVYWKLSKKDYQKTVRKFAGLAKEFYRNAQQYKDNPVQELSNLIKSYESVFHANGGIVMDTINGNQVILNTYIPVRIENLLSGLDIQGGNTHQSGTVGNRLDGDLLFQVKYNGKPLVGLPVRFSTKSGGAEYKPKHITDNNGECRVLVNRIQSDLPDQEIQARIDLIPFLRYPDKSSLLIKYLEEITSKFSISYYYSVSGLLSGSIAVKVFSENNISNAESGWINHTIITELKKKTNFQVMERDMMEEVLKEQGFNNTCSTTECQVEVGKILAVRKMIFINIIKNKNVYRAIFKLINIETTEIQYQESFKFKGTIDELYDNGIPEWVTLFNASINIPTVTFTSGPEIEIVKDDTIWAKTPVTKKPLSIGEHNLTFRAEGFEPLTKNYKLILGMRINEEIRLVPKTRRKAFTKSMIFPGLGQFYASDANHRGRRKAGIIFSVTSVASIAVTAISWSQFQSASNDYTRANQDYLNQKQLDQIVKYREIAHHKNDLLISAERRAWVYSGILATIWVGNALEAVLHFPDYHNNTNLSSTVRFYPDSSLYFQYSWNI